jgi:phenylacetate-coenzyme A ligase PaaK-like adenylate-forming protein
VTSVALPLRSSVAGVAWPAVPDTKAASLLALLYQFDRSQWWPPEQLRAAQFGQLALLLAHAAATVPFYRERLAATGFDPQRALTGELWQRIPILERREVQQAGAALQSAKVPHAHGKTFAVTTSGSTGRPVTVLRTAIDALYWDAHTLRGHLWHRGDLSGTLAVIRAQDGDKARWPHGARLSRWGNVTGSVFQTGPAVVLNAAEPIDRQLEWLGRQNPDYLIVLPTHLGELVRLARQQSAKLPRLKGIETLGGVLAPETRRACRDVWGVAVADTYSAQELGYMALQCPEHEHFHVTAESVLVEVVSERGEPCAAGEIGRVVVTPLHNFAMPLIRYAIGDYAEVGPPCACGRGLPVLARILGRVRNLLTLPTGERIGAMFVNDVFKDAPVAQFQVVQHAPDHLEMRIVPTRPFTPDDERSISDSVIGRLGHPFRISFSYLDEIPRGPGGKFEDFRSEITT